MEEVELDEVFHNVKEVPPMIQTQIQNGYNSLMIMLPTFGAGYCDSKVGTRYYDSGVDLSSSYMNANPSTSYMH